MTHPLQPQLTRTARYKKKCKTSSTCTQRDLQCFPKARGTESSDNPPVSKPNGAQKLFVPATFLLSGLRRINRATREQMAPPQHFAVHSASFRCGMKQRLHHVYRTIAGCLHTLVHTKQRTQYALVNLAKQTQCWHP